MAAAREALSIQKPATQFTFEVLEQPGGALDVGDKDSSGGGVAMAMRPWSLPVNM